MGVTYYALIKVIKLLVLVGGPGRTQKFRRYDATAEVRPVDRFVYLMRSATTSFFHCAISLEMTAANCSGEPPTTSAP
jgi:hypothetical protein